MVTSMYKAQKKNKEGERLTGEIDKIKFNDVRFERGQVVPFGKGRRRHLSMLITEIFLNIHSKKKQICDKQNK